jgi:acyl-coenzyme A thioesterase 9
VVQFSFQVSNTFYFAFTLHSEAITEPNFTVRKVVPATEEEARRVIQRYDAAASHRRIPLEGA